MKKIVSVFSILFFFEQVNAQTNLFPLYGNVGIGLTPTSRKLEIADFIRSTSTGYSGLEFHDATNIRWQLLSNAADNNKLQFWENGSDVRMTLLQGGKVGIGLIPTSRKLEVADLVRSSSATYSGLEFHDATNIQWQILSNGSNSNRLQFWENGVDVRMTFLEGGNVGIGTATPLEKLSVDGNITANGFITAKKLTVTQTGWSDYVFDKDYKLRSLSSLEAFINQNKHLPDIPSAKEVEEKGISVGDNQALLLKKIEELTLYVIDLKKENQTQQNQLNKQAKAIQKLMTKK
jgi:hypothetical protein